MAPPTVPLEPPPAPPLPPEQTHAGPAPKPRLPRKKRELPPAAVPWNPKYRPKVDPQKELIDQLTALAKDPDGSQILLKQINAELAKADFAEFCRQAWHVVEPATKLQWNWHHQLICEVLQALFEDWLKCKEDDDYVNAVRNTVFNLPPGSLKSRLIAVFFMAWCWIRAPGMKFICLSVNEEVSLRDARACRDLIKSDWYQTSFRPEWKLKGDQDAISNYGNTAGGERLSKPSGSEIVGLRGDCVAGETLVATESGELSIRDLHERAQRGEILPRVWSMNHETNVLELKKVQATRHLPDRKTVLVRTQDDRYVRCTPDHRFFDQENYTKATHLRGREVSVLRRPYLSVSDRQTSAMSGLPVRSADLCSLQDRVSEAWRGVRQTQGAGSYGGAVLQQALQDDRQPTTCTDAALYDLQCRVQTERERARHVFAEMCGDSLEPNDKGYRTARLWSVFDEVSADVNANDVLLSGLRRCGTFHSDDGSREFELLRSTEQDLRRRSLGELSSADSRTGRQPLCGLREYNRAERQRTTRAPYRREHTKQLAGEFDHALRQLPHDAPQISTTSVLSVDEQTAPGRDSTVDVYDIQVEGNHNFFANGILVHNCLLIDDANNPHEAENASEREKVNSLWDTNIYNRVNDPLRSLRIGVQQRTNAEDWTGHVIKTQGTWWPVEDRENNRGPNGWLHVVIPAEYERDRRFVMPKPLADILRALKLRQLVLNDPRKEEGESVHPERFSKEYLEAERKRWEGTGNYAGQMQQSPVLREGGRIKRSYFNWFRLDRGVRPEFDGVELKRPRPAHHNGTESQLIKAKHHSPGYWDFDWMVISVDCAVKKTDRGSNWGIVVVAGREGRRYVLDDKTKRADILEVVRTMRDLTRFWRPDKILIEAKAASEDLKLRLLDEMNKGDMPMITLEEVKIPNNTGKEERLDSCLAVFANGFVHLLDGAEWLEAFVNELSLFPNGAKDDRVDAITQVLNHYKDYFEDGLPDW